MRSRIDVDACLQDEDMFKALKKVVVYGYRYLFRSNKLDWLLSYGIKAAWSTSFFCTWFQSFIEDLDRYSQHLNIPARPIGAIKPARAQKSGDLSAVDPEFNQLDDVYSEAESANGELRYDNNISGDNEMNQEDSYDLYGDRRTVDSYGPGLYDDNDDERIELSD